MNKEELMRLCLESYNDGHTDGVKITLEFFSKMMLKVIPAAVEEVEKAISTGIENTKDEIEEVLQEKLKELE